MYLQPGSSVRFPATKAVDRQSVRPFAAAELDDMPIVPITIGKASSGRPDLLIGHLLRRLFGEQPPEILGIRPAHNEHAPQCQTGPGGKD